MLWAVWSFLKWEPILLRVCVWIVISWFGKMNFCLFLLLVDSFNWRETNQMKKMFYLFWHFWFTTWVITRLLWIAGHTFPVQWFSFYQLNCKCVLWRICFLSIKLRMLYQIVMGCLFLIRLPFLRVKSCQDEVWSLLRSSSIISLLLPCCSVIEKKWYLVTILQRKHAIQFHPFSYLTG